jgi:hypothetical protein
VIPLRRHLFAALASCAAVLAAGSAAPGGSAAPAADTQPPSVPQGMAFTGTTRTTVGLVWRAATDDVGVAGYRLYRNGTRVATVTGLKHTFRGLRCGTRYTFALEAVDAAGNASYRPEAVGSTTTSACAGPAAKPASKPPPPTPRAGRPKPAPAPRGTANVWIDANGGSCQRSGPARFYRDAESCRDLQSAYHAARSGDTIGIRTGTYPGQTLAAGTKAVTFRAAGPGRPSFGHFVSAAANITVRGILIQDRSERTGACSNARYGVLTVCGQYQTYDNVIVDGLNRATSTESRAPAAASRSRTARSAASATRRASRAAPTTC